MKVHSTFIFNVVHQPLVVFWQFQLPLSRGWVKGAAGPCDKKKKKSCKMWGWGKKSSEILHTIHSVIWPRGQLLQHSERPGLDGLLISGPGCPCPPLWLLIRSPGCTSPPLRLLWDRYTEQASKEREKEREREREREREDIFVRLWCNCFCKLKISANFSWFGVEKENIRAWEKDSKRGCVATMPQ